MHPHLSRAVRQHFVSIFELYSEHRVGQWLDHRAFEHDGIFLGLGQVTLLKKILVWLVPDRRRRARGQTEGTRMWLPTTGPATKLLA